MRGAPDRIEPNDGQESVWDYPRPPRIERVADRLMVCFAGRVVADTADGLRVLETSHPPVYYVPRRDVATQWLLTAHGRSFCEFKGEAAYVTLAVEDRRSERAGWFYPRPSPAFAALCGHFAFYASRVDEAWVGEERVIAQEGDFYGGWITSRIVGPFKGPPGTADW